MNNSFTASFWFHAGTFLTNLFQFHDCFCKRNCFADEFFEFSASLGWFSDVGTGSTVKFSMFAFHFEPQFCSIEKYSKTNFSSASYATYVCRWKYTKRMDFFSNISWHNSCTNWCCCQSCWASSNSLLHCLILALHFCNKKMFHKLAVFMFNLLLSQTISRTFSLQTPCRLQDIYQR